MLKLTTQYGFHEFFFFLLIENGFPLYEGLSSI